MNLRMIPAAAVLLIALICGGSASAQDNIHLLPEDLPNVLLLQSYHQGFKWSDDLVKGVLDVLGDSVQLHVEYMDTKKHYSPEYLISIKDYLKMKASTTSYDLIIVADNNAFNFLKEYRRELYGSIPIVFTGLNFLDPVTLEGMENITGISEENNFKGTLDLIIQLFPEKKNLVCIVDQTVTGLTIQKKLNSILPGYGNDHFDQTEIWSGLTMDELTRDLELLGDDFIVFNILFQRDKEGHYYEYNFSNSIICQASNAPVFGSWDFQFPYGTLGGYVMLGFDQGREAGLMARRILEGEDADDIPVEWETPHRYMFDFKELLKYSVPMVDLPADRIIINLPQSLYYEYHTEIAVILVAFIFLLILIYFLHGNVLKRKDTEAALQSLNETLNKRVDTRTHELKESNDSLHDAMVKLQNTQRQLIQKERLAALGSLVSGIAHEINTPLGVGITASSYIIDLTRKLEGQLKEETLSREDLEDFLERIGQGSSLLGKNLKKTASLIDSFKNLSFDETAGERQTFDLYEYMEEIIRTHRIQFSQQNIQIELKGDVITLNSFPGSFYHVMNNLLSNSMNHGFSGVNSDKKITISLFELEGMSGMIEYRDNGRGIPSEIKEHMFEPFTTTGRNEGRTGLGLFIIFKTINEKLGGAVDFGPDREGAEREGVCFRIYFPIERPMDNS